VSDLKVALLDFPIILAERPAGKPSCANVFQDGSFLARVKAEEDDHSIIEKDDLANILYGCCRGGRGGLEERPYDMSSVWSVNRLSISFGASVGGRPYTCVSFSFGIGLDISW
jgi:hypothetical protein